MFGFDDLLDFGASLYSAQSARAGQESANETNMAIAAMNNQTMIDLANTAHQREVKDLIAAGLNPVLSVDGAGAPVPALTSAKVENAQKNNIGSAINQAFSAKSQRDAVKQQDQMNKANIEVAKAQAKNLDVQNAKLRAEIDEVKASTAQKNAGAVKAIEETKYPGFFGQAYRAGKTFTSEYSHSASSYDDKSKKVDLMRKALKGDKSSIRSYVDSYGNDSIRPLK